MARRGADRLVGQYIGRIREWSAELNLVPVDERGGPLAVERGGAGDRAGPPDPEVAGPARADRVVHGRTRPDGNSPGPWIRTHPRLGVRVVAAVPASQTVTGTVWERERWTGLVFPESGGYVVPRGLGLLRADKDGGQGVCAEPDVRMRHM
ncbi:hypothetical protein [Streptomyces griseofuscus]|uniref:hypothetical protein n=1 Tax=Streptomyces griseofuscus TaxID=146922 RepID=UPI0033DE744E